MIGSPKPKFECHHRSFLPNEVKPEDNKLHSLQRKNEALSQELEALRKNIKLRTNELSEAHQELARIE